MPPAPTNSGRVVAAAGRIRSCSPFVNAYGIAPYKERGSKLAGPACFTSLYGSLPFLCDNEKVVTTYLDKAIPLYLLMHLLQNWPVFLYREIADLPGNGFQIIDDGAHIRESRDRDRKSTRLNSSHTVIYTLSLHDALPISSAKLASISLPRNR